MDFYNNQRQSKYEYNNRKDRPYRGSFTCHGHRQPHSKIFTFMVETELTAGYLTYVLHVVIKLTVGYTGLIPVAITTLSVSITVCKQEIQFIFF